MKYNELNITRHHTTKRKGRGIASGKGKTAGRGTKGQGSRTGHKLRPGFEGGQNPMMQQLPKLPGFTSKVPKAENIFTGQLEHITASVIDTAMLAEQGLISNQFVRVKLLVGKGELHKKVSVKLQGASATAIAVLEAAGGSFESVPRAQRPTVKPKTDKKA